MVESIKSKLSLKINFTLEKEYCECVWDLIDHEKVKLMKKYMQHGDISCYDHSLHVSYISFRLCKKLGLDPCSAARGGLLHDFFLYDWHTDSKPYTGLHGFVHPSIALKNANEYFSLNNIEKDIIEKHMWPLTLRLPKYKESYVVLMVDKYCATFETWDSISKKLLWKNTNQLKQLFDNVGKTFRVSLNFRHN